MDQFLDHLAYGLKKTAFDIAGLATGAWLSYISLTNIFLVVSIISVAVHVGYTLWKWRKEVRDDRKNSA